MFEYIFGLVFGAYVMRIIVLKSQPFGYILALGIVFFATDNNIIIN